MGAGVEEAGGRLRAGVQPFFAVRPLVGGVPPGYTGQMTDAIRQWMEKYIAAWETNAPDDIRALFAEDAVYATRPYDPDAWRGREQIVDRWIASADEPEDWRFEWSVLGSDGDPRSCRGVPRTWMTGPATRISGSSGWRRTGGRLPSPSGSWSARPDSTPGSAGWP